MRDSTELMRLIYQGNAVRRVAATKMNDQSSRSHSVFTIRVEQKTDTELEGGVTREITVKAKINLGMRIVLDLRRIGLCCVLSSFLWLEVWFCS